MRYARFQSYKRSRVDWIGYLPDKKGHELGGYQTWTGLHSYAEPGTGERVVDAAVGLLDGLAKDK